MLELFELELRVRVVESDWSRFGVESCWSRAAEFVVSSERTKKADDSCISEWCASKFDNCTLVAICLLFCCSFLCFQYIFILINELIFGH